jgi:hypothetical protein
MFAKFCPEKSETKRCKFYKTTISGYSSCVLFTTDVGILITKDVCVAFIQLPVAISSLGTGNIKYHIK